MANLYSGVINTDGEYEKLSELTSVTFTTGKTYTLQIQNMAYVREGTAGNGFLISSVDPFKYTPADGVDLYIKTDTFSCVINIAED